MGVSEHQSKEPKRVPLTNRKTGITADSAKCRSTSGGVTATPSTGSIPRIKQHLADDSKAGLSPASGYPHLRKNSGAHPAGPPTSGRRAKTVGTVPSGGSRPSPQRSSSLSRRGWVPDQHGAWAMVTVPLLVGIYLSGPVWQHLVLAACWLVGYFAFFAAGLWLRSRRKERYWPPVRAYGITTLILLVILLAVAPALLEWSPIFMVLIVVATWQSVIRRERSLLSRTSTVLAAGMMIPLAYDMGTDFTRSSYLFAWLHTPAEIPVINCVGPTGAVQGWTWVWVVTACLTAYYWSAIPYVKTLIRARESRGYLIFSIAAHAVLAGGVLALALVQYVTWSHFAVWVLLLVRATAMPLIARYRKQPWRPRTVGWTEVAYSVFVLISLLFI